MDFAGGLWAFSGILVSFDGAFNSGVQEEEPGARIQEPGGAGYGECGTHENHRLFLSNQ